MIRAKITERAPSQDLRALGRAYGRKLKAKEQFVIRQVEIGRVS